MTHGEIWPEKKFLFVALVDLPSAFISCAGGHGFPASQGYLKKTVNSPFTETWENSYPSQVKIFHGCNNSRLY